MNDDIGVVKESLERVRRRAGHVVRYFYAHLFSHHPELRPLFPADMDDQYERLFAALVRVVDHLGHPGLPAHLERLGRDHRKFGISDADYTAVGESLIASIRYHSTHSWNTRTETAWLRVYTVAAATMTGGARQSLAANEPACWDATVVSHRLHGGHTAVVRAVPSARYPCLPGQYASVEHPDLPGVWRPYSVAGRPERDGILEFHIGRVPDGLLSTALCDHTVPGRVLRVGAASGSALPPPLGTPAITLIAAGTGWSAVKAVLDDLLTRRPLPRIRIDVVARSEAHFYDGGALADLQRDHPGLKANWWYQQQDEGPTGAAERLHRDLGARRDWEAESVYLCGPAMFAQETAELLHGFGLPAGSLVRDPLPPSLQQRGYVSHAEKFLDPLPVNWIDPDARTRPLDVPAPETAPLPTPGRAPALAPPPVPAAPGRGGWFEPHSATGRV
ncbi:globin domain-containing protein [Streptomyces sp. NBC_01142]|uniref:globin domain-containing protein n=1 Tax=Streptomyces sp. NBC_01142 TaxID=2975865 RepID=UPI002256ABCA|nr:globin domain-containing protein [Streptomyces sp. NBC_01142]MCX4825363.1 globin domain-containing protein [Streptomyces sp. NBC_01142]